MRQSYSALQNKYFTFGVVGVKIYLKICEKHLTEIRNRIIFKIRIRISEVFMDSKEFFYELGRLVYKLDGVYEEYGRSLKVGSANLLWILYALNDGKRHSQKEICNDWDIPRSTANTIVKDLQGKGYVELSQIKGERRELLVSLTDSGKQYANGILSDLYKKEKQIYGEIENPESIIVKLKDLLQSMQKISK